MVRRRPPSRSARADPGGGYLAPARPRAFAHRGLAVAMPENTIGAFQAALDAGATYIETDVHASADSVAVIAHDPDLERWAGVGSRVRDLTFAQLQEVDLGSGQRISALGDALARFPEARFNIDVKSDDAIGPTASAILEQDAQHRVLVTSFSERRRSGAIRALPGVASSASALRFAGALVCAELGMQPLVGIFLRGVAAVQIPERALGLTTTRAKLLDSFHRAGVEVHIWTINDPARMRTLLERGVDGIVTDRVDLALEVIRSRTA